MTGKHLREIMQQLPLMYHIRSKFQEQSLGGVLFQECFGAYAPNLQGVGAPMQRCDFHRDAYQKLCWNLSSAGCVPLSVFCVVFGTLSWDGLWGTAFDSS